MMTLANLPRSATEWFRSVERRLTSLERHRHKEVYPLAGTLGSRPPADAVPPGTWFADLTDGPTWSDGAAWRTVDGGSGSTAGFVYAGNYPTLQGAVDATPDGGVLVVPPISYSLGSPVQVSGKSLNIVAHGASFVQTANAEVFTFAGTYGTTRPVTGISTTGQGIPTLTTSGTLGAAVGDVVKVVSDDVIDFARPGSGGAESRWGEFAAVAGVSGSTVTLAGPLRGVYSSNVRVAVVSNHTASITGGTFIGADPANGWTAGLVTFRRMLNPRLLDIVVDRAQAVGFTFLSCLGYTVRASSLIHAHNDTAAGQFGYSILDKSSTGGRVDGVLFGHCRHGFTTDTARIAAGTTDLDNYGPSVGFEVADCHALGSISTAFDTHHGSEGGRFADCTASNSNAPAFGLRGRNHTVVDGVADHCRIGVDLFDESVGGESYGHVIDNLTVVEPRLAGLNINLRPTGHPQAGARSSEVAAYVRGVLVRGGSTGVEVRNGRLVLDHYRHIVGEAILANDDASVVCRNSEVQGKDWTLDYRENVSGALRSPIFTAFSGTPGTNWVEVDGVDILLTAGVASRIEHLHDGSASTVLRTRRFTATHAPWDVDPQGYVGDGSRYQWSIESSGANSEWTTVTQAQWTTNGITRGFLITASEASMVTISLVGTPQIQGPALPAGGRLGKNLRIVNSGTGNAVVKHGASYLTSLDGDTDKTVVPGAALTLTWDGSLWRQWGGV